MGDQVIILDLLESRYIGLGGGALPALAKQIGGWPRHAVSEEDPHSALGVNAALRDLQQKGLVTDRPGRAPKNEPLEEPTRTPDVEGGLHDHHTGAMQLLRFAQSIMVTSASLRTRNLLATVTAVSARRSRLTRRHDSPTERSVVDACTAFSKLRPFAFTAKDQCLFDSLALVTYLHLASIPAQWVIGIRTKPFIAHSWVQHGSLVLNDQHMNVRQFSPILVA